ncbi:MAG: hypothetical protein C0392_02545, partial [Syntrophus sp. (in: bacteria)]|nr:hypothetical protein [Syntrophus sp. (in: bacteria)]
QIMLEYLKYLAICAILTVFIMSILIVLRKAFPHKLGEPTQQVAGYMAAFVATIYAFILGFSIMVLWQMHDTAESTASKEVNELRTMYRLAKTSPHPEKLSGKIIEYLKCVHDEEWKDMAHGHISKRAEQLKEQLWEQVITVVNTYKGEGAIATALLDSFIQFNTNRQARIGMIDGKLHPLLFIALMAGGIFTIMSFYFLSIKNSTCRLILDAALIGTILVNLYLVYALNKPFSGTQSAVSSKAFSTGLEAIYLYEEKERSTNKR